MFFVKRKVHRDTAVEFSRKVEMSSVQPHHGARQEMLSDRDCAAGAFEDDA